MALFYIESMKQISHKFLIYSDHPSKKLLDCLIQSDWIYDTNSNSYAKINCENFEIMSSSDVQATHAACIHQ